MRLDPAIRAVAALCLACCLRLAHGGPLWPLPLNVSDTGRLLRVHPRLRFAATGARSTLLDDAFARYEGLILDRAWPAAAWPPAAAAVAAAAALAGGLRGLDTVECVSVYVASSDQSLGLETDERYTLTVAAPMTVVEAASVFGALRALETLAQLVNAVQDDAASCEDDAEDEAGPPPGPDAEEGLGRRRRHHHRHHRHHRHGHRRRPRCRATVVVGEASIHDAPRFRHRGLLVDTARHFLPPSLLRAHLDAMAMAKLNVLHWHLVDDQSFPYMSQRMPELAAAGAFSPAAVYAPRDVAGVVAYARARGIRVLPEFDTPGHVASWGASHPEVLTECFDGRGRATGARGPMTPAAEAAYALLWRLLREAAPAFPDAHVHLGGDEVDTECWESNPEVRAFMARQGLGRDFAALQQYHTARALALAAAAGKAGVVWQEAAQGAGGAGALRNDTVVQVWKWAPDLGRSRGFAARDSAAAAEARRRALRWLALPAAAARNDAWPPPDAYWRRELERVLSTHRAVLSAPWYLNLAPPAEGAWAQFWRVDPLPFSTDPGQRERMLGGEACAWGELIDATNALTKTWPLAAAVAERLWVGGGGGGAREEADAGARLAGHRCRMRMRGVDAAPLRPGACPQEAGD